MIIRKVNPETEPVLYRDGYKYVIESWTVIDIAYTYPEAVWLFLKEKFIIFKCRVRQLLYNIKTR